MEEKYKELIQKGNTGENKSLLLFKGKYDNKVIGVPVPFTEDTEKVIEKYTKEQIYQGKNIGVLYELIYKYDYDYVKKIPFERMYDIEKSMIGYIDKEGNFYPISSIEKHNYSLSKKGLSAGIKARNIVLSSNISDEEKEAYKNKKTYHHHETGLYPWNWSADKILKENNYCLFLRCIDEDGAYADYSHYDNITDKQLIVLNYLFNLNYTYGADIEDKRKTLIKKLIENI